ncbi:MliC family protein [Candidatus Kaiserbacteria bacterium]|nr:MliC family protein [Candidatus Kaiserbacteria bacterium]
MQPVWHGAIGLGLIVAFFCVLGVIAYQLYGPGIDFDVPDYLLPAGWATTTGQAVVGDPLADYAGALFECADEKALKAEFLDGSIRLVLSDGRQLSLPQTVSASGVRYANTDESFVFWNKGITAYIEESGTQTYSSCLQQ